jgi:hypothetical protein
MIDKEKILKHIQKQQKQSKDLSNDSNTSYKDFLEHFSIAKYFGDLINSIEKGKFDVKESSLWLTFEENMPRLNQEVEVKFKDGEIKELFLTLEEEPIYEICRLIFVSKDKSFTANLKQIESWRHIPEEKKRKPDLYKHVPAIEKYKKSLNKGDLILINCKNDLVSSYFIGFFKEITGNYDDDGNDHNIYIHFCSEDLLEKWSAQSLFFDFIQKIIRINFETKEFEEI